MTVAYKIIVKGRVQGVWFRKYTKDKADSLNLSGFARNELDGSVYIEVEGEEDHITQFIGWLDMGSPLSKVNSVDVEHIAIQAYQSFEIRR
ncbi:MAG: acylphosphatase [Flavobacteriaceae bacterium]|nr:acylphosphatase [Flavobacteriaceae bacterium]